MNHVRDEISVWLEHGAGLSEVEGKLIEAAPALSEDERAALWLFGWSYRPSASRESARVTRSMAG
ncbi:MAG: hypothetical protein JO363_01845 [Solirubrobacterales bacterium]|nr:hypothetical protein [Solirubrobacterales bacterium]